MDMIIDLKKLYNMTKCLVTKLKGVVLNDSLNRIGEFRFRVSKVLSPTASTAGKSISVVADLTLTIIGDGYFTDSTLTKNLGKVKTITPGDGIVNVFFSNGDYEVVVSNKYKSLEKIQSFALGYSNYGANIELDLEDFKFSKSLLFLSLVGSRTKGDIKELAGVETLKQISLTGSNVTGNVKSISGLGQLTVLELPSNVTANLSDISEMKQMTALTLEGSNVTGDLSSLADFAELTSLSIRNGNITGDIASLRDTKVSMCLIDNGIYTGDLAKFPSTQNAILYALNAASKFTWTSRSSSDYIFGIRTTGVVGNLDTMLQDLSKCQVGYSGNEQWKKNIIVKGTRTSASDSAITVLQNKGYSVSITPA